MIQALGADGIGENFNAEQLEECDVADVDSCFLLWINGQSHRTVFEVRELLGYGTINV